MLAVKPRIKKILRLIVIDYLQLMQGSTKGGVREQEISSISRSVMPFEIAFFIFLLIINNSNTPILPLYPNPMQFLQSVILSVFLFSHNI